MPDSTRYTPKGYALEWLTKVIQNPTDECILWPFGQSRGYGSAYFECQVMPAHQLSLLLSGRERPKPGEHTRHLCGIKLCINPRHLTVGSPSENNLDKNIHNRTVKGEKHSQAVLLEEDIRFIRTSNKTQRELAHMFGINQSTVSKIKLGLRWSHVE